MDFGLPSAIGAKVGRPESLVINIDGDASFCMSLNELATTSERNIDVKTIILNNNEQGMVTQLQKQYYQGRYSHAHQRNPDFVGFARAMSVEAMKVEHPEELERSLKWLLESPHSALLEVVIDGKALVRPTVISGKGLGDFLF